MLYRSLILIAGAFLLHTAAAFDAGKFGLVHHRIEDDSLGPVDVYVVDTLLDRQLPVVLFLDGSGANALFTADQQADGTWRMSTTIPFSHVRMGTRYHVAFVAKPGVALLDSVRHGQEDRAFPAAYTKRLSARWRTLAASRAVDLVLSSYPCDRSHVAVLGFSEGAQVAPRVAVHNPKVTHVMAFAGDALNQLFDLVVDQRMAADRGEITHTQAQAAVDSLFRDFARIYADPSSTTEEWFGHSLLRWSSFTSPPTIEYLSRLDIPIYFVHGTMDSNGNVVGTDYVRLEFLRLGKKNLTHVNYPGCDHHFNCWDEGPANRPPDHQRMGEAFAAAWAWFDAH